MNKTFLIQGPNAIRLDTVASVSTDEVGHAVLVSESGERFPLGRRVTARDALFAVKHFAASDLDSVELPTFLKYSNPFPTDPAYWLGLDQAEALKAGQRILSNLNSSNVFAGLKSFETGLSSGQADTLRLLYKEVSQHAMSVASTPEARATARTVLTRLLVAAATKR